MITTTRLPCISGREPTWIAAQAAPQEIPASTPSRRAQASRLDGGLVVHGQDLVDHVPVEHVRHEARADALDLVWTRAGARQHG